MAAYSLTDRQKDMLRSIASGLENGTISPHCIYLIGNGRVQQIVSTASLYKSTQIQWEDASESDFADFEREGLLKWTRNSGQGNLMFYSQKIIDAVKSNFGEDEQTNPNGKSASLSFDPVFGIPSPISQYKADIFVMMPFKPQLKHVYDDAMKPAAQSINLTINRGDDFFTKHTIMTDIWSAIYHCRLVIADCTGKNANVFYELGMAHTIGRPVILLAQKEKDIPFDIRGYRRIIYNDTPEGLHQLTNELKTVILKALEL